MDVLLISEITFAINRTKELIDSRILWETKPSNSYHISVLIEILVHMKDLLKKSEKHLRNRITFNDDIIPDENLKIFDVTDLISNFRDAACHNDSFRRKFGSGVMAFNEIRGKGQIVQIGNVIICNKYSDDIAFNMGKNILYLKRHLERAFQELDNNFKPFVTFPESFELT